jgi:hypothetical protein
MMDEFVAPRKQRRRELVLPGIFPYYGTGNYRDRPSAEQARHDARDFPGFSAAISASGPGSTIDSKHCSL